MRQSAGREAWRGFSLVEVTLALGVIAFALVAILGVFPAGLRSSLASQNETRAAQFAAAIFAAMDSQAATQFNGVKLPLFSGTPPTMDLANSATATIFADNDGKMTAASTGATYRITVTTNSAPTGLDPGYANQVTVGVAWPANAPAAQQTLRNFARVISKQ